MSKPESWQAGELHITKLFEQFISLPAETLFPDVNGHQMTEFALA
ncbi:hypothetical protein [Erwinia tracheiphila]|nr:hypothetical protein [Erwinia tracheiphila]